MRTATIKLGGETFKIAAMNLGQIREAMPIMLTIREGSVSDRFGKLIDVLQIMVSEDYPDTVVSKLRSNFTEMMAAFTAIADLSGFEEQKPGEAKARAKSSTSRKSTAA